MAEDRTMIYTVTKADTDVHTMRICAPDDDAARRHTWRDIAPKTHTVTVQNESTGDTYYRDRCSRTWIRIA